MASASCTNFKYRFYNGGWSSWSTTLHGGYAGNKSYVTCFQLKTPSLTSYTNTKLTITVPYVRQSSASATGKLFARLYTTDPTGSALIIPTASTADAVSSWSTTDLQVHTASFSFSGVKASTTYYILIGANSNYLQIGYKGYDDDWSAAFTYSSYTAVGKGSIEIIDNYNNTFTVKGTKGANGTNNLSTGPTISWGYTSNCNVAGAVTNQTLNIPTPANATRTVYAKCVTGATLGSGNTVTTSLGVRQYVAPSDPGVPVISYTKSKLTLKENWNFTWPAATAINDSSPVVGYRIRVYKNNELVKGIALNDSGALILQSATNEWIDRDSTSTSISFNPIDLGFKVGNTVSLGIYAYTRYGVSNTGDQLFNTTAVHKISAPLTVQNAGIANVNINGSWKEGQVYVNIGGAWKEAESVHVNVAGTWKESQ